jgi:hypothetical protein
VVTVSEDDLPERLTQTSARAEKNAYLQSLKNRPIPAQYANLASTPLKVTVSAGQKEYKIELRR